jgi:hypothetical protein
MIYVNSISILKYWQKKYLPGGVDYVSRKRQISFTDREPA